MLFWRDRSRCRYSFGWILVQEVLTNEDTIGRRRTASGAYKSVLRNHDEDDVNFERRTQSGGC